MRNDISAGDTAPLPPLLMRHWEMATRLYLHLREVAGGTVQRAHLQASEKCPRSNALSPALYSRVARDDAQADGLLRSRVLGEMIDVSTSALRHLPRYAA